MLQALAGVEVTAVRDLDSGLDTAQAEGRSRLPWHKGDLMLTFTLDNVHTLTLRASGTEPKLKYYLEVIINMMVQQANLFERLRCNNGSNGCTKRVLCCITHQTWSSWA